MASDDVCRSCRESGNDPDTQTRGRQHAPAAGRAAPGFRARSSAIVGSLPLSGAPLPFRGRVFFYGPVVSSNPSRPTCRSQHPSARRALVAEELRLLDPALLPGKRHATHDPTELPLDGDPRHPRRSRRRRLRALRRRSPPGLAAPGLTLGRGSFGPSRSFHDNRVTPGRLDREVLLADRVTPPCPA